MLTADELITDMIGPHDHLLPGFDDRPVHKGYPGELEKKEEPIRDSISGLTREQRIDWDEFVHGAGYDSDPLRRYVRAHGGHCSGGGGCS